MENLERFLNVSSGNGNGNGYGSGYGSGNGYGDGSGSGSGYGDGNGYGSGYGDGDGYGDGSGSGYGDGDGSGNGYGDGYGIKRFCGQNVYCIDGVNTLIDHIRGNLAKGRILREDLTTQSCYVVKQGNMFAHGSDLHKAMEALSDKLFEEMSEDERIDAFIDAFPDVDAQQPNQVFFDWHHRLTGSCEMGRMEFARQHNVDVEHGTMSAREFLELTKNAYGGESIRNTIERIGLYGQNERHA